MQRPEIRIVLGDAATEALPRLGIGAGASPDGLDAALRGGIRYVETAIDCPSPDLDVLAKAIAPYPDVVLATTTRAPTGDSSGAYPQSPLLERLASALGRERLDIVSLPAGTASTRREWHVEEIVGALVGGGFARAALLEVDDPSDATDVGEDVVQGLRTPLRSGFDAPREFESIARRGHLAVIGVAGARLPAHPETVSTATTRPSAETIARARQLIELLATDGRSPAQGVLGYLWSLCSTTLPVVSFRSAEQARGHLRALERGAIAGSARDRILDLIGTP